MKYGYKFLFLMILTLCLLSGCEKKPDEMFKNIDASEIEKIECSGFTGEKNGGFSYSIPEENFDEFAALLGQVKLGHKVDRNTASSSGAVSYFTLYFKDGHTIKFSPMSYFFIDDTYYVFENYEELQGSFGELKE